MITTLVIASALSAMVTAQMPPVYTPKQPKIILEELTYVSVPERSFDSELARLAEEYGQDEKLARRIIKCESKGNLEAVNRNHLPDGYHWSSDWGPWQVNDYYHKQRMERLGLNIYDIWDNLEYGFLLMKAQGTKPWNASAYCWSQW